jgi:tetratricopeptide (TPR) repeat protein
VAKALTLILTRKEKRLLAKRYTENAEAYQAYLKGRYFFNKRTKEGLIKGIEYFNQAITIDANYALAWAGLADCYIVLSVYDMIPPREGIWEGKRAALRALQLDETLAEAHTSLGHLSTRDWDWSGAEKEFKRAIDLKPNYATAHAWYAVYLRAMGRFQEAMREARIALKIDPLSLILNSALGSLLYLARQYDQAIEQLQRTLEMDPGFGIAHFGLGLAYEAKGIYEEALIQFQQAMTILGDGPELRSCLGRIYALSGRKDEALHGHKRTQTSARRALRVALFNCTDLRRSWRQRQSVALVRERVCRAR